MDTQKFDFDDLEREKFVRLAELSSEDHSLVRELQREVIAPNAASIVDAFYERLRREPEFETILKANRARIEDLKITYRRYLLSFGVDFESADYFRERLRIGAVHASVGVPLSLYLAAGRLLQQLTISHVLARARGERRGHALVDLVLKLTTMDTSLAIETYHGTRVGTLESSVEALRTREEKLVQVLLYGCFDGSGESPKRVAGVAVYSRPFTSPRATGGHHLARPGLLQTDQRPSWPWNRRQGPTSGGRAHTFLFASHGHVGSLRGRRVLGHLAH